MLKNKKNIWLVAPLLLIACTTNNTDQGYTVDTSDIIKNTELIENIQSDTIDDTEKKYLLQMREEEKLAHDVYVYLGQKFNLPIFTNISSSERSHANAVKVLLERYNIEDPVTTTEIGTFSSNVIKNLYTTLIEQGSESVLNALIVGATIEDLDIHDLQLAISQTNNEDSTITYANLAKGSRNHLRAFIKQITKNGGNYEPQYITSAEFIQIINSSQETGRIH